jgi:large subunit ribosomal protein L20
MTRIKRGVIKRKKHKKVLKETKGYYGSHSRSYRLAKEELFKSLSYSYRDRKNRKRTFRELWIIRINAAARSNGISYNEFINGLKLANIEINRKMLSEIAVNDPGAFQKLAEMAKKRCQPKLCINSE